MEQLGASVISLKPGRHEDEDEEDKLESLITSTKSLSAYQSDSFKSLLPQIIASLVAASFYVGNGISMSFSSVIISQLEKSDADFTSTSGENAIMASIITLVAPPASVISGFLMDKFGRMNTIKMAIVPGVVGWVMIAMAPNMTWVIIGRILVGTASCFGTNPAVVYITEIANPKVRLSLMQITTTYVSLGMTFTYLAGWWVDWRIISWVTNVIILLPVIAVFFIPESPLWLIYVGKLKEAKESLNWLYKYQPKPPGQRETFAELQYKVLKKQQDETQSKSKGSLKDTFKEFMKPTGYKPLIIMCPLFFCQHFSGIYITMFYSITFIQEAGTNINPFLASSFIGVIRFVMAIFNIFVLKYVNRRTAIMISAAGMAVFMYISGQYTLWIKEGSTTSTWVPVAALLMYVVFSVTGLMFLPFMVCSELFPLEIRGVGYTIGYSLSTMFMFGSLQSYYWLNAVLGGATNLQWFFAVVCTAGVVYTYIFLPETRGKRLTDISDNFKEGWLYIGKSHKDNPGSRRPTT